MRILVVAAYISDENVKEFCNPLTGYGYIIRDIANHLGETHDVYLLTRQLIHERQLDNIHLVRHQLSDTIKNLRLRYVKPAIKSFFRCGGNLYNRFKNAYFFLNGSYLETVIQEIKPDIVHIHGAAYVELPCMLACTRLKVPYVITLHGLVGLNQHVPIDKYGRILEGKLFRFFDRFQQTVSIVSTGAKEDAVQAYNLDMDTNICVVCNPVKRMLQGNSTFNLRSQYHIPSESQIMICIGNICARKNQVQLVRAYARLGADYARKLHVFFMGEDRMNGELQICITKLGLEQQVHYLGYVPHADISSIYQQAQYNALISIDEGFGLSVIEGYSYGIPSIVFDDMQAVKDIYSPVSLVSVKERSDEALSAGIQTLMDRNWDADSIISVSQQFSFDKICDEYTDLFKNTQITKARWSDIEQLI
ncbi:glycosyltransferase family 4 protein [Oscillospiraceae bacterium PP1C4]